MPPGMAMGAITFWDASSTQPDCVQGHGLAVVSAFHHGEFRGLFFGYCYSGLVGEYHHKTGRRKGYDRGNAHCLHGEFSVKALLQIPCGNGKRRECAHDEQGIYRVEVAGSRCRVERGIKEVGEDCLGAICRKLCTWRSLHPRVGDDDPQQQRDTSQSQTSQAETR